MPESFEGEASAQVEVPLDDLADFERLCSQHGLQVTGDRDLMPVVESVVTFGPVAYETARFAIRRISGSHTGIVSVDNILDRKRGGHVIRPDEAGGWADARSGELAYGVIRVVEARRRGLDILAQEAIVDKAARLLFAKRVKDELNRDLSIAELGDLVRNWDGVEDATIVRL